MLSYQGLAKAALAQHPNDLQLMRLEAQALRHSGKADQGIALLADAGKKHARAPLASVSAAQAQGEAWRRAHAGRVAEGWARTAARGWAGGGGEVEGGVGVGG